MGASVKACTLAGNTISSAAAARFRGTTRTMGIAIASVSWRSAARARWRGMIPAATITATTTRKATANSTSRPRPLGGGCGSGSITRVLDCSSNFIFIPIDSNRNRFNRLLLFGVLSFCQESVNQSEENRNKEQSGDSSEQKAADNGASERRILFAAFSHADRHGQHADDHRQGSHQHRTEASEAGFERGFHRGGAFRQLFLRETYDQD